MALADGRPAEAVAHLEIAIRIDREQGTGRPQMRYLSYYGLAIACAQRPTAEAIRACETAAKVDFFNPDLHLNLGKVYLMAGRITPALATLERARKISPWHRGILAELSRVDRRAAPPIRWLGRDHVLNRGLGKLRAALGGPARPRAHGPGVSASSS